MFIIVLLFCTEAVFGASVKVNINGIEKFFYPVNASEALFEQFMADYDKHYNTEEKLIRSEVFKSNIQKINELNIMHDTVYGNYNLFYLVLKKEIGPKVLFSLNDQLTTGVNKYSDLTDEEFSKIYVSNGPSFNEVVHCEPHKMSLRHGHDKRRRSFDWREKNAVTPVKFQGECRSCWAHSIVASLESQYAIKYGQLLDFSEQQLVDCDLTNKHCERGWSSNAAIYIMKNGLMSEADYPYVGINGTCQYDPKKVVGRASSCLEFKGTTEEELKEALVKYGPISIFINALSLRYYQSGIERRCRKKKCDHLVLLVGYSDEGNGSEPYWILKNSWGESWGENGYFKLPIGSKACRITECEMVVIQV